MSYTARHAGRVKEGQLVLSDPVAWRAAVARHEGRDVWVTVARQQHNRTMDQNKYYWGVVIAECASYCGLDRDEMHEALKAKFLPVRHVELLNGLKLDTPPTTKTLTVEEFTEYIESIKRWAAQWLHLSIPDANQVEVAL